MERDCLICLLARSDAQPVGEPERQRHRTLPARLSVPILRVADALGDDFETCVAVRSVGLLTARPQQVYVHYSPPLQQVIGPDLTLPRATAVPGHRADRGRLWPGAQGCRAARGHASERRAVPAGAALAAPRVEEHRAIVTRGCRGTPGGRGCARRA